MFGLEDDLLEENRLLHREVAALKEQLRWRKQSEEPAPHGVDVLNRFVDGGKVWVVNGRGECVLACSEWLPVPP